MVLRLARTRVRMLGWASIPLPPPSHFLLELQGLPLLISCRRRLILERASRKRADTRMVSLLSVQDDIVVVRIIVVETVTTASVTLGPAPRRYGVLTVWRSKRFTSAELLWTAQQRT